MSNSNERVLEGEIAIETTSGKMSVYRPEVELIHAQWDDPGHPLRITSGFLGDRIPKQVEQAMYALISERLNEVIKEWGSFDELAKITPSLKGKNGISSQYLRKLVKEPCKLTKRQVDYLCYKFGCTVDYLRRTSTGRDIFRNAVNRETLVGFIENLHGQSYTDASRVVRAIRFQDFIVNTSWVGDQQTRIDKLKEAIPTSNRKAREVLLEIEDDLWRLFAEATAR